MIRKYAYWVALPLLVTLAGCGTPKLNSTAWTLPPRENAQSAMVIGRIDYSAKEVAHQDGDHLYLERVVFSTPFGGYLCPGYMPCGERNYIMNDKNYFVVPNLKPGKYYFRGFSNGGTYNGFPYNDNYVFSLKPGEILFLGSYDYDAKAPGAVAALFGSGGSFSLSPAKHPTEREMLLWLAHVGKGSGWEPNIRHALAHMHSRR